MTYTATSHPGHLGLCPKWQGVTQFYLFMPHKLYIVSNADPDLSLQLRRRTWVHIICKENTGMSVRFKGCQAKKTDGLGGEPYDINGTCESCIW